MSRVNAVAGPMVLSALIGVALTGLSISRAGALGAQVTSRIESFHPDSVIPMHDFTDLVGEWEVESRSLLERMTPTPEWRVDRMRTRFEQPLEGLVAINHTWGMFNDQSMSAIMIRTYDPDRDEWRFQWMSSVYPRLTEQVRGRFTDGTGAFFGCEEYAGVEYEMRFRWKRVGPDHFFWEQAYRDPRSDRWVVNWTLDFTR